MSLECYLPLPTFHFLRLFSSHLHLCPPTVFLHLFSTSIISICFPYLIPPPFFSISICLFQKFRHLYPSSASSIRFLPFTSISSSSFAPINLLSICLPPSVFWDTAAFILSFGTVFCFQPKELPGVIKNQGLLAPRLGNNKPWKARWGGAAFQLQSQTAFNMFASLCNSCWKVSQSLPSILSTCNTRSTLLASAALWDSGQPS